MAASNLNQAMRWLYEWQYGRSTSFSAELFRLIQKADSENRSRLFAAFPQEAEAFNLWYNSDNPDKLFEEYGLAT